MIINLGIILCFRRWETTVVFVIWGRQRLFSSETEIYNLWS